MVNCFWLVVTVIEKLRRCVRQKISVKTTAPRPGSMLSEVTIF